MILVEELEIYSEDGTNGIYYWLNLRCMRGLKFETKVFDLSIRVNRVPFTEMENASRRPSLRRELRVWFWTKVRDTFVHPSVDIKLAGGV